ncbi:MAG: DUF350 domain-containing protein [Thermodesulfobacteriota bacterium]|nr:DUF350 domain-containing protein [Thermodesulfobacteriota bacterium]
MNLIDFLLVNFCNGLLGAVLLVAGYKVFDLLTPGWDFADVFKKNTITNGGVVIAAFLVGLAIVIASTAG